MAEIENLPQWATEFARELRRDEAGYTVVNNLGEFRFEIRADRETGVIDMLAGPSADEMSVFPTRVVGLGDRRTAFIFTMFQAPGMPDDCSRASISRSSESSRTSRRASPADYRGHDPV